MGNLDGYAFGRLKNRRVILLFKPKARARVCVAVIDSDAGSGWACKGYGLASKMRTSADKTCNFTNERRRLLILKLRLTTQGPVTCIVCDDNNNVRQTPFHSCMEFKSIGIHLSHNMKVATRCFSLQCRSYFASTTLFPDSQAIKILKHVHKVVLLRLTSLQSL